MSRPVYENLPHKTKREPAPVSEPKKEEEVKKPESKKKRRKTNG